MRVVGVTSSRDLGNFCPLKPSSSGGGKSATKDVGADSRSGERQAGNKSKGRSALRCRKGPGRGVKRENITFIDSLGPKTNTSGPQAPPDPKHKTRPSEVSF